MISGTGWGTFGGASVFGPVQINGQGSEQLIVTGTGLNPSTDYECNLIGSSDGTSFVASLWPDSTSQLTTSISTSGYQFAGVSSFPYLAGVGVYNSSFTANGFYAGFMLEITTLTGFGTQTGTGLTLGLQNNTTGQISAVSFGYNDPNFPNASAGSVLYIPMIVAPGDELFVYGGVIGYTGTPFLDGYDYAANCWGISSPPSTLVQSNPGTTVAVSTPYGASLDVLPYGGATHITVKASTVAVKTALAAPPAGFAYRLHSLNWVAIGTGVTSWTHIGGANAGEPLLNINTTGTATQAYQFNGLLLTDCGLGWSATVAAPGAIFGIQYDLVSYPYPI
jgi:hypothetical protein